LPLTASPAWYGHGGTADFGQTLTAATPDPNLPGTAITQPAATFMMLPQTLPAGAKVEVVYTDNLTGTPRTLTADINGTTWTMGKTMVYRISTGSIVQTPTLEVTAPADYEYTGGNKTYTVASYLAVTGGGATGRKPIAWTAEFSEDGGLTWSDTKPAWLTTFTASGAGGTSATSYPATVAAQVNSAPNPHTVALKSATQVNNYDLSTKGGTAPASTANCYIVNAPGTYRLPLVYGNAIKGGVTNSSAYTSTASGANILNPFINHSGAGITNPYIYNNALTPANATLVWQDEKDLVTNVKLSTNRQFLEFTVNRATIRQGNAVVAVRDASNTVLWSWHIWVTDYKPGTSGTTTPDKEITNHQGKKYKIMSFNLGWCDGETKSYAERTVQVRFKQKPTAGYTPAATQTITVKQKAHTITELGNNTYYQWGRKDPFVGALAGDVNKTWYDASGASHTNQRPQTSSFVTGNACITSGITLPNTFCTNYYMDNTYYNLWDVNNNVVYTANDNVVIKTIYDPSPVGYKLPPSNAFTGFTTTGDNTSTASQFNVQGAWSNGWNFYCNPSKTQTVFFPASGWRYTNSARPNVGGSGFFWSAGSYDIYCGWYLDFGPGHVNPLYHNFHRSHGLGVRPCRE
ncbi:fimbrillin family protein, partial [Bacteroides heparinolyticus]|uniref:fimbrillin family protein n=1 Tax=Prevotella heparinolytica TaxID=28113 RepID=UPI00359F7C96